MRTGKWLKSLAGATATMLQHPISLSTPLLHYGLFKRSYFPSAKVDLHGMFKQEPNPSSRIRLSRRKDPNGLALPVVEWQLTPLTRKTVATMVRLLRKRLRQANLGTLTKNEALRSLAEGNDQVLYDQGHHMGTTRMAARPEEGVVDPDCKVFGVDNLYIGGSSVFPTGGHSNPTLTLVALAIRLGDHLSQRIGSTKPLSGRGVWS